MSEIKFPYDRMQARRQYMIGIRGAAIYHVITARYGENNPDLLHVRVTHAQMSKEYFQQIGKRLVAGKLPFLDIFTHVYTKHGENARPIDLVMPDDICEFSLKSFQVSEVNYHNHIAVDRTFYQYCRATLLLTFHRNLVLQYEGAQCEGLTI